MAIEGKTGVMPALVRITIGKIRDVLFEKTINECAFSKLTVCIHICELQNGRLRS